jgi:ABC-type Na+ efflux pump permease subunit
MNDNADSNYISFGSWMWMIFVTSIPVVGLIMALVWAFTGDNQSRRNCFQALIAWALIAGAVLGIFGLFSR